jgi:hypothetical protein
MHTHDTITGMVLHRFGKLKPIPIPMHTISTLSWVYLYLCHALVRRWEALAVLIHSAWDVANY